MMKELIYYHSGHRYSLVLDEGLSQVTFGDDKSDIPIPGLSERLTCQFSSASGLSYTFGKETGVLVSGLSVGGGVFYLREATPIYLEPLDGRVITLGGHPGDHLLLALDGRFLLTKGEANWQLSVLAGEIYHNNNLVTTTDLPLLAGSELSLGAQTVKVYPDELQVWGFEQVSASLAKRSTSRYGFYEDYPDYHRSPRLIYRPSEDKLTLNAPPTAPNKSREGLLKLLLPPLLMIRMTIVMSIIQPRGIYVFATVGMSVISTIFSVTGYIKQGKQHKLDLEERTTTYRAYLADKARELSSLVKTQVSGQHYHYPAIAELSRLANRYDHRIYEKTPLHFDFLHYRLGLGTVPVSYQLSYNQTERSGKRDPLELEGYALYNRYRTVPDMPIVANLTQGPVGYIGPRPLVIEQLQLMVNQLALFHSYHDVQFITIMPEEELEEWEWMRFLPHASLQAMNVRGFVYNQRTQDQVLTSLNQILKVRQSQASDKSQRQSTLFSPHYVVLVTDEKLILDHMIMEFFREDPTNLGCSIIFVQDVMSSLSENIKTIVNIKDRNTGQLVMEAGQLKEIDFALDHFPSGYDKESLVRRLAPLNHLQNLKSSIPDQVTFLELYEAEEVSDLGIVQRWESNAPYKSLAVPLGLRGKADKVYLNLHEKAHGPHGLVAGTTGSGKSEVIQSYILSLAVNFHPHDVAFLLIDYKGGGMANLFKDLPHLLGTITNLDGAQSMRALVSINAELKRRQRLFSEHDVNHINQYQKKYKLGEVPEPMPHLFLISDEFAELKANQPDFMKELVSTARIGRSLGIHLILATQKPSGVVDDQIWSNSRFKLALKVADRSDSMEMLKTPDAAEITQVGRGYLQVGNNEVYELFQSAWSGAAYQPDKDEQGIEDDTIYAINDLGQYEILNDDLSGLDHVEDIRQVPTELDTIVASLKQLTQDLGIAALPQPWLPPLEERIYVEDLDDSPLWSRDGQDIQVTLGMLDRPQAQSQDLLRLNLTEDGHLVLYGSPATGKTTFLQTLIFQLARTYSPAELHLTLLDFGTGGLLPLGDLPHVTDVMLLEEGEKIAKFIRLMDKEIARRKKLLSTHKVNHLNMYRQVTGQVEPALFLILDSFEGMKDEAFEGEMAKLLTKLSREGQAIGIHLVMTASRQSNLRATLYANFKHQLTLKQHDKTDARSAVGASQLEIEDIKGRGLIKLDDVYSFQIALPVRATDDIALLDLTRQEVARLASAWTGQRPEGVPMVPEELTVEDFYGRSSVQAAIAQGQIPLGLDLETVEAVSWKPEKGNFIYLYEKENQLNQQVDLMMREMEQAGYKIALVQPVHGNLLNLAARLYNNLDLYEEMIEALGRQLEQRMSQNQTDLTHLIVWAQYDEVVSTLSTAHQETLATLFDKGARYGFVNVVATTPNNLSKLQDKASRVVKTWKEGLLAVRVSDQSIISPANRPLREGLLAPQEHYVVADNVVSKIIVAIE